MSKIQSGRLLTEEESREVKAALALAGSDLKRFAAQKGKSYSRLLRMVSRVEVATEGYARVLNELVGAHLGRFSGRRLQAA